MYIRSSEVVSCAGLDWNLWMTDVHTYEGPVDREWFQGQWTSSVPTDDVFEHVYSNFNANLNEFDLFLRHFSALEFGQLPTVAEYINILLD